MPISVGKSHRYSAAGSGAKAKRRFVCLPAADTTPMNLPNGSFYAERKLTAEQSRY